MHALSCWMENAGTCKLQLYNDPCDTTETRKAVAIRSRIKLIYIDPHCNYLSVLHLNYTYVDV